MKTRTFVLNDTITARRIKQLIRQIELCKATTIDLYLSSDGGLASMSNIFVNFTYRINKKINLIGCEMMASCCVDIFIRSKGKKSILPYTCALLHHISVAHESRNILNKKSYESVSIKEMKKENSERLDGYSHIFDLSNKEISILKNGGDLGIDHERLKKALPKINKLKLK